jgi:hypothetical protein
MEHSCAQQSLSALAAIPAAPLDFGLIGEQRNAGPVGLHAVSAAFWTERFAGAFLWGRKARPEDRVEVLVR